MTKIKRAFQLVKSDINSLNHNVQHWVYYLHKENEDLKRRIELLERGQK